MNKIIFIAMAFLLISCNEKVKTKNHISEEKEIKVGINNTIETFMILRALSDTDPLFKYRKVDYKGKPIMFSAREYFKEFKNDTAVKITQELLEETSSAGDVLLQGLLYANELPNTKLKYELNSYWKTKESKLIKYLNILKDFYITADVEGFLSKNEPFYKGAIEEAKSYLNKDLIPTMESYFGEINKEYQIILIPNSPFGMGFGAEVGGESGKILYQIISPANDIEWQKNISDYKEFGYSGEDANEYYRDMVAHEFCHSFITTIIEQDKYRLKINETDSLFIPKLNSIMAKQGYDNWWNFFNEHLVRLCEIRISKEMGIDDLESMRKFNVIDNGFLLIPDAEKLITEYENNRKKYPTFKLFLPKLIDQLKDYTKEDIENKMAAANNVYKK
jgi:hypothetical protein